MNKGLFSSLNATIPVADAVNNAGGVAYSLTDKEALAQMAMTCVFQNTFYMNPEKQLDQMTEIAQRVDSEFIAKLAVYARDKGHMKDMPAALLAILHGRKESKLFGLVFDKVIKNGRMLRGFVAMVRSGKFGRKSFGQTARKRINKWLNLRSDLQLVNDSVGNSPSLGDIIKMTHPHAVTDERERLFGWLIGKPKAPNPIIVQMIEDFRKGEGKIPDVNFQLLTSTDLSKDQWRQIFINAGWQFTRMNLNTAKRHGLLDDEVMVAIIAMRLASAEEIGKAKVFPFQTYMAWKAAGQDMPLPIQRALNQAADLSLNSIPAFPGRVQVIVDVSASMGSAITENPGTGKTGIRAIDAASLIASAILRTANDANVIAVDTSVRFPELNPTDSLFTNATKLASYGGGGTSLSVAYEHVLKESMRNGKYPDLIVMVSDNESWVDCDMLTPGKDSTPTAKLISEMMRKNKRLKVVNINLTPSHTSQVKSDKRILNIGGFSDQIFEVISTFVESGDDESFWVRQIEETKLGDLN